MMKLKNCNVILLESVLTLSIFFGRLLTFKLNMDNLYLVEIADYI